MHDEKPKLEVILPARTRIILTPERIEAIQEAIEAMKMCEYEYGSDFEKSIAILEDMIDG